LTRQCDTPLSSLEGRTFHVTHPFHPLFGQTLELVATHRNWGSEQVYYHDSAGRLRLMPLTWTSLKAEDPIQVLGAGRSPFKLVDLLELARCLERLQQPIPDRRPLPPEADPLHGGVK